MDDIIQALCNMAKDNAVVSMLSCTHGQLLQLNKRWKDNAKEPSSKDPNESHNKIYFKVRQVELDKIVDVVFELLDQAPDPAIKKSSVMPRAINMHSMLLKSH
ncbi:hypothetical protein RIF29_26903 [Crotalaria pallida]|uniref:Uncharacterized protein n=1 Tax=Crotalaria pallida TaxID=3830 RepID=A0AAN9ENT1_CROPI